MNNISTGNMGESIAENYLIQKGYKLIKKNFRWGHNEIDLIFEDEKSKILIFVEVKARYSLKYGEPEESISRKKQKAFINAVNGFMSIRQEFFDHELRIDTIGIILGDKSDPEINHTENSFY